MFRLLRRILLRTPKGGFCPLPRDYCPAPGDPPDQPAPEVLVVEGEAGFTPDLVEQAVAFAKRLGYGLVALSCLPEGDVEQDDHRGPWEHPLQDCREYLERARRQLRPLVERAQAEGIAFRHLERFGVTETCVREVSRISPDRVHLARAGSGRRRPRRR